ncbi:MAG: hypothetical protein ACTHJQ_27145 [Rhizobiaceae bacterium]
MKIKMLTSMAGANFALSVNEETERFPDEEAARLIAAGYAVPVAEPKTERAVKQPAPEKRG